MKAADAKLATLEPKLRDMQRAGFRDGNEGGLQETADAIANVLDTGLAAKEAIDRLTIFAEELQLIVGQGTKGGQYPLDLSGNVRHTVDVLERINKVYAKFQLVSAGIDLLTEGKTANQKGHKGVAAMSTLVGAGGTLLNASAGFSLYGNLYIGPMVEGCLTLLGKLEDRLSKTSNRDYIEAGRPEMVNWSLEPGGRPMFDFMMVLMQAGSAADVPEPPKAVDAYFVDNEDDFSAGVGKKGGELRPTRPRSSPGASGTASTCGGCSTAPPRSPTGRRSSTRPLRPRTAPAPGRRRPRPLPERSTRAPCECRSWHACGAGPRVWAMSVPPCMADRARPQRRVTRRLRRRSLSIGTCHCKSTHLRRSAYHRCGISCR